MAKEDISEGRAIGIDLGTTNSVVAVWEMEKSRILHNMEYEQQTRSIVGFDEGEILIGAPALKNWPLAPEDTIVSIKRLMGRAFTDPDVEKMKEKEQQYKYEIVAPTEGTKDSVSIIMGGKEYSPVDISAMILSKLKNDAEFVLNQDVKYAVITVPAYFSEKQKFATREAGLKAGLTVLRILDEPTAVALAFGLDAQEKEAKTVLVFDLGGGTFDISVLMMTAGTIAPLNLEGDMWLGGDDFDQLIVDYVLERIKKEKGIDPTSNKRFMITLKMEAQKAKETLSSARTARIIVPGILNDSAGNIIDIKESITREQFEDMIDPHVNGKIVPLVKKAVENANLMMEDVDHVLMAGNSSCVPKVQQAMEQLFGQGKVLRKIHPKNSVAIGASLATVIYGGKIKCPKCDHQNVKGAEACEKCGFDKLQGIEEKKQCPNCHTDNPKDADKCVSCGEEFFVIDLGNPAPFHYGVQTRGNTFNVFINKGDSYPTPEEKRFLQSFPTTFPNQRWVSIPVYGGDHLEAADQNEKQGEAFAILPPNQPQGTPVSIKLWLNEQGSFELSAHLEDGTDLEPWIMRGKTDQEAKDIIQKSEEIRAKKEQILSSEEREKGDTMRNGIIDKLKKKEFKEAKEDAKALQEFMEQAGQAEDPQRIRAEGLINFVNFVVNEYGWLIGQAGYQLNKLKGELQEAMGKNDTSLIEAKLKELEMVADKLLRKKDPMTGKIILTDLGVFLELHGAIASVIQPVLPVDAQNLREELKAAEMALKNKSPDAKAKFDRFIPKFKETLEKAKEIGGEGIKCPSCGHENPFGVQYCAECKTDLWLLGHDKVSSASKM